MIICTFCSSGVVTPLTTSAIPSHLPGPTIKYTVGIVVALRDSLHTNTAGAGGTASYWTNLLHRRRILGGLLLLLSYFIYTNLESILLPSFSFLNLYPYQSLSQCIYAIMLLQYHHNRFPTSLLSPYHMSFFSPGHRV